MKLSNARNHISSANRGGSLDEDDRNDIRGDSMPKQARAQGTNNNDTYDRSTEKPMTMDHDGHQHQVYAYKGETWRLPPMNTMPLFSTPSILTMILHRYTSYQALSTSLSP
jgi:hypothetical protein